MTTTSISPNVKVCDHPIVQYHLTRLRDYQTCSNEFRRTALQLGRALAYEAMRDLNVRETAIETPLTPTTGVTLADYVIFAPILRAGLALAEAAQDLAPPNTRIYHVGLKRDEETLKAVSYYCKLPDKLPEESKVYILDPMLATGGSACDAITLFQERDVKSIHFVCFLAAPEGLKRVLDKFPNVKITTASIDSHLNEHGYIVPGLGDAGDRIFGT